MKDQIPDRACLHELFEAQARRTPDARAVEDAARSLTYAELDRSADFLAAHLRSLGLRPDGVVGVYMERSAEFVVACLAALKAGGGYLPLELAYPPALLEEVVADSAPRVVLTRGRYEERLPREQARLCMDDGWEEGLDAAPFSGGSGVDAENLAFVSYSSGTTGKPKGIANPHRAAVRSYLWRFGISDYGPGDRVGCNVFFIWEMLRPLLRGVATVVIPDDVIYHPAALVRFLREREVTEVLMTPSLLEAVLDASAKSSGPDLGECLPKLRTLWLNGEVVTRTLARRARAVLPGTRLLNVYSCSETHEVAAGDLAELVRNPHSTYCPVGRPMDPETTYILDGRGRPVPDGGAGELYVGGDCLARDYVNLPEKTEESFPPDPFSGRDGARMYRSGDKARILPDGSLEILGRTDFMVKIRGYSVELGAVEAAIEKSLAVRASVVVAEGDEGEDKRLVAYLVPSPVDEIGGRYSGWEIDARTGRSPEIRRRLGESLPHYAVPAVFVETAALPLHPASGKIDRKRLPPPPPRPAATAPEPVGRVPDDAPRPEKEALLARVWEEVLRLEGGDVRPDDDFFDLGGHSLAAAQLSGRVEEVFSVHVTMPAFMEDPTVAGLCDRIEALQRGEEDAASPSRVDLRAEAVLEDGISPDPANPAAAAALRDARDVFMTGATGFLGAFLLAGLLSRTDARVNCLVRRRDSGDLMGPIRENLGRYGLAMEREDRVVPVAGDLGEPLFGLSEEDFDRLARETDLVIHAGAAVNLIYPYESLKAANVDGTREVLRLACARKTKPVHHVSTNGIFPPDNGVCGEDVDLDALADAREDGYGQSKWVAERLVREAGERGLPVRVYRPGNISGHGESGASNPRDLMGALIAEILRLGRAPEVEGWRMEMTPVDFVARAILHLADDPETVGNTFHLANPDPVPAEVVFGWLEGLGYPLERLPYAGWLRASRNTPRQSGEDMVGGVLAGASGEQEILDANTYDDANTRRYLGDDGPRRPAIDAALFERYVRYFAERGWIETPPALSGRDRASA